MAAAYRRDEAAWQWIREIIAVAEEMGVTQAMLRNPWGDTRPNQNTPTPLARKVVVAIGLLCRDRKVSSNVPAILLGKSRDYFYPPEKLITEEIRAIADGLRAKAPPLAALEGDDALPRPTRCPEQSMSEFFANQRATAAYYLRLRTAYLNYMSTTKEQE